MRKSISDILNLQNVDLRIRELEERFKKIAPERAKLVSDFNAVKKTYEESLAAVREVEKNIRICHSDNESEQEKLKASKIRSGVVKKAAEYEAVLSEIATHEQNISDLETKEIGLYEELDKVREQAEKVERSYKATGRMAKKEVKELDDLKVNILDEIKKLAVLSIEKEKFIPQAVLDTYKRLLSSGKGIPLSPIHNGLCGNCNLSLPPMTLNNAMKGNMVECDNCSYLLYQPDLDN